MALDLSKLSPQDAIAALKSYPRRFAETLEPVKGDDTVRELAARPGPEGRSAIDITADTAEHVALLDEVLHTVMLGRDASVADEVVDGTASTSSSAGTQTIESAITALRSSCEALAGDVGRVPPDDWTRTVMLQTSGREISAFDLVRAAVRVGSDNLHATEAVLRAVRR